MNIYDYDRHKIVFLLKKNNKFRDMIAGNCI